VLIILGSVVAAVLAVIIIAFWPEKKEPEYRGKKLSEWLPTYDGPEVVWRRGDPWTPAGREALRQIGTNAIPCLIRWIRYERPVWKDKVAIGYGKLPRAVVSTSIANRLSFGKNERLRDAAMAGFEVWAKMRPQRFRN